MESHEEKLHNMIKISKIESAKDQAKDAAKAIKERQRELVKSGGGMQGIGGGDALSSAGSDSYSSPPSNRGACICHPAQLR
jgi:hypothetical protein